MDSPDSNSMLLSFRIFAQAIMPLYSEHLSDGEFIGANPQRIISGTKKNCLLGGEMPLHGEFNYKQLLPAHAQ